MKPQIQQLISATMALVVFTVFSAPRALGSEHIVSLSELREQVLDSADSRARNVEDIQRVLSYPAAADALRKSGVNQQQVQAALAALSDEELKRLSDRARASEKDVEGGLIVGLLALIGLIVVIIIVVSVVAEADLPVEEAPVSA